jgi:hypothetical protein
VQNRSDLAPVFKALETVLREGMAAGDFRPIPPDQAVETIHALYTMGLRSGVFGLMTTAECVARVQQVMASLLRPLPGETRRP